MDSGRLLILDDDSAVGEMIQDIAASVGMTARYLVDPGEFFDAVEEWNPTHLAIDLKMPKMDGVEVLAQLAKRNCQAAIIVSSGVGDRVLDAAARSATERGLNIAGILSKPFTPKALRSLLAVAPAAAKPVTESAATCWKAFEVTAAEVKRALEQKELQVFYQPKVECKSGKLVGCEALSRWRHPEHGLIMPDTFIPIAEASMMMGELTRQVMDQTLSCISRHFNGPPRGNGLSQSDVDAVKPKMAVNMSPQVLRQQSFVEDTLAACSSYGVDPDQLILELTESSAMENPVESLAMLTRLRVKGFHLSIDDFGTGYSPMVQLVQLPFSEIKIDKSFVMTANRSEESRSVIKSIVSLGHSLGLYTVAEGVENAETLEYLSSVGCDAAQGYLISRPIPECELLQWISTQCVGGCWAPLRN